MVGIHEIFPARHGSGTQEDSALDAFAKEFPPDLVQIGRTHYSSPTFFENTIGFLKDRELGLPWRMLDEIGVDDNVERGIRKGQVQGVALNARCRIYPDDSGDFTSLDKGGLVPVDGDRVRASTRVDIRHSCPEHNGRMMPSVEREL